MKITTARLKELATQGRAAMPMKAELEELISKYNRNIPDEAVCFFNNGTDEWCCVFGDFISPAESPTGIGKTFEEALNDLKSSGIRLERLLCRH